MRTSRLVIFVKAPRPGFVKTRLARALGPVVACEAYADMVNRVVGNLTGIHDVELCFNPDDACAEIQSWLRPGWTAFPQGEGDLGARMARAFERHFATEASRVVLIGSDCPWIGMDDIRSTWNALEDHDLVVGPATDGGYWLVGLRRSQPALFTGIDWSTNLVLAQTLERAREASLRVQLLRELTDVDTEQDWQRFQSERGVLE